MRVKSQQCFSSGIGVVVNLRRSAGDDRYFCAWPHTDLLVPSLRDQTLLAVEQVESEKERFLSGKIKLLFLHPVSRRVRTFQQRTGVVQLSPKIPSWNSSVFSPSADTQERVFDPPERTSRAASLLILRERDQQSATFT